MAFEITNGELTRFTEEPDCTGVIVPPGVTGIGPYAFAGCTALREITLPPGIRRLSAYAFAGCTALQNISLSPDILHIGSHAFENCTALRTLALPDGLGIIDVSAFQGCSGLRVLTLPETIFQLQSSAFFGCISLREIRLYPDEEGICRPDSFWRIDNLEEEICDTLEMLRHEYYRVRLEPAVKYPFMLMKYDHEPDEQIAAYIRKKITRILTKFIEYDDEDMISALLRHRNMITPQSIDTCICRALNLKQHRIYAMLADCKNRYFGFAGTEHFELL